MFMQSNNLYLQGCFLSSSSPVGEPVSLKAGEVSSDQRGPWQSDQNPLGIRKTGAYMLC